MVYMLYAPRCPVQTPGQRGQGTKHSRCFEGKLLTRELERPERELQSKQRPHFCEEKQTGTSTANLPGQQKSLSRSDVVQFVNPGGH